MPNPIANALVEKSRNQPRDESYFHPSEATGCSTAVWYKKMEGRGKLLRPGVPFDAATLAIFEIGHMIHGWVQGIFVEKGLCGEDGIEVPIHDDVRKITGSIDILLPERDDMEYHEIVPAGPARVVDIKSCSWTSFSSHRYPEQSHVVQTSLYCHYTGLEDITILYICKDGGKFDGWLEETGLDQARRMGIRIQSKDDPARMPLRCVNFKKDEAAVQRTFEKFAKLEEALASRIAPVPEYDPRERWSPCQKCQYRYHCREAFGRDHPGLGPAPWDKR